MHTRLLKSQIVLYCIVAILFASCNEDDVVPVPVAITSFSFEEQAGEARIDNDSHSININAKCGTDLAGIVPEFVLSNEDATAKIGGVRQVSGKSDVNFSEGPVVYTLTTADGEVTSEWEVSVTLHEDCLPNWAVNLQKRDRAGGTAEKFTEKWNPGETAIIVIDMWGDMEWEKCAHNSLREKDMSLAMNTVFDAAREKGILVVFAPSAGAGEFDKWYGHLPARHASEKYRDKTEYNGEGYSNPAHWDYWWHGEGGEREQSGLAFPGEKGASGFPGGTGPACESKTILYEPQPPQTPLLEIKDNDIITDDFVEMMGGKNKFTGKVYDEYLFKERGIKNVIITGCHTDICIIGRPFGCRGLVMAGYNVVLCRDLTNCSIYCNTFEKNGQSHVEILDKLCNYVERWICPSITSTEITGNPPFQFDEEKVKSRYPR